MARGTKKTGGKSKKPSPVLQQFFHAKEQYPDALLFFRMGDFYELFFDDAVEAADLLDITLTSRGQEWEGKRIPMAGVPHHAAAGYLAKLLRLGRKVALCEQVADPKKCKGLVPREVVRVVTPGLCLEPAALDARTHNYLATVVGDEHGAGLAAFECSTGELRACTAGDRPQLLAELVRLDPREILLAEGQWTMREALQQALPNSVICSAPAFAPDAEEVLSEAIGAEKLEDAKSELPKLAFEAALVTAAYTRTNHPRGALSIAGLRSYDPSSRLLLDEAAVRNLEIAQTLGGERKGSLLGLLDTTKTALGARLMRRRLLNPTTDLSTIHARLGAVEQFLAQPALRERVRELLANVGDLERLTTRVVMDIATPRDLASLRESLVAIASLREVVRGQDATQEMRGLAPDDVCPELCELLQTVLEDEPALTPAAGKVIRAGVDEELDEQRLLSSNAKDVMLELEKRERERTGVATLKVKYNRVFGYFIEISKAKLTTVPETYRRKQTMATAERFTTDELDELQVKVLNADERATSRETELFEKLRSDVSEDASRIRALAGAVSNLDVFASFADVAHRYDYIRPEVEDSSALELRESRHPIVERMAAAGRFVANDIALDASGERLMVITGPNMSGKSTVMRQVALSVVMAQAGCFVPASSARIGVVDRVYTRVGASDNLSEGQSTFMVEMREAASIMHGATARSLVILDEIGRGTSTYDGLAIAWAIAEHLHDVVRCRGMFATHYHELCQLAQIREGVANYNVAARERGDQVVFLHRLTPGGANRSYGVAVAKLAGIPEIVLARAKVILKDLESGAPLPSGGAARMRAVDAQGQPQLELFAGEGSGGVGASVAEPSEVERTLAELDPDHMTPVDALLALARLKGMLPPVGGGEDPR